MTLLDTEDREVWYQQADKWEQAFCTKRAHLFGLSAKINPNKTKEPWDYDLVVTLKENKMVRAELKPQFSPFFMAHFMYDVDPQFAFSFNVSDYNEYKEKGWNDYLILYWIEWRMTEFEHDDEIYRVAPMLGLWWSRGDTLFDFIESKKPPIHEYKRRLDDPRPNAKSSYVFDVRNFTQIRFAPPKEV